MRALFAGVAALLAVLAGCTAPAEPVAEASPPPESPAEGTAIPTGPPAEVAHPPDAAPVRAARDLVLWLTPERGLGEQPAAEGAVPLTWGIADLPAGGSEPDLQPWVAERPLGGGWRATAGSLELHLRSDAPQPTTSHVFGFESIVVWFGRGEEASPTHQFAGPPALQPGAVAVVGGDLVTPAGGYVLEDGALLRLIVGLGYAQNSATPVHVVTGPEASRVTLRLEPYEAPAHAALEEHRFTGAFPASFFLAPADALPTSMDFPLDLPPGTARLAVALAGAVPGGPRDLDVVLLDPSGDRVWGSTTPLLHEAFSVHDVNLPRPGTYTVRVHNFAGVQATFEVVAVRHAAA